MSAAQRRRQLHGQGLGAEKQLLRRQETKLQCLWSQQLLKQWVDEADSDNLRTANSQISCVHMNLNLFVVRNSTKDPCLVVAFV